MSHSGSKPPAQNLQRNQPAGRVTHPFQDWILDPNEAKKRHKPMVEFQRDLNNELGKAFPTSQKPYDDVQVLLLCWDATDQANKKDLQLLSDFLIQEFNYDVQIFYILGDSHTCRQQPNIRPLITTLNNFLHKSHDRTLSIVFYSGHGWSNVAKGTDQDWSNRTNKYLVIFPNLSIEGEVGFNPNVMDFGIDYKFIVSKLDGIGGEVLHVLECCNGGGVAVGSKDAEFLSASAATEKAKYSPRNPNAKATFTNAFMNGMQHLKDSLGVFSTVQLHSYMVTHALDFQPALVIQPFYTADFVSRKPIQLTPLLPFPPSPQGKGKAPVKPKKFPNEAKVLLSISLDESLKDVQQMTQWLRSPDTPPWIREIKVVGFYPSQSTKMIITMPICLWSVLPEDPAYVLMDFIIGGDVIIPEFAPPLPPHLAIPERSLPIRPQGSRENVRPSSSGQKR